MPADPPLKAAHLKTLPEHRLVGRMNQGAKYYVYSHSGGCHCLYIGGARQYQNCRRLLQEQRIAEGEAVDEAREWEIENSGR